MTTALRKRITIFDLTRFIAMLFMIQGHTIYAFLDMSTIDTSNIWWVLWAFNRGFTAPVFLVVSGAVQIFANKRDENGNISNTTLYKRLMLGLSLIIISYLMHLPGSFFQMLEMTDAQMIRLYQVNILQLIGFCLIFNIILMKIIKNDYVHLVVASIFIFIFAFGGYYVESSNLYQDMHPALASYITFHHGSIFPIFPTAAFYCVGLCFGIVIKKTKHDQKFFIRLSSIVISLVLFLIFILQHSYEYDYFKSILYINKASAEIVLFRLIIVFLYIFIVSFLDEFWKKKDIILMFGKRALLIYILHLYFIYNFLLYTKAFNGYFKLNIFDLQESIYLVFLVVILTLSSVFLIDFALKRFKVSRYLFQFLIAFIIIIKLFPFF